MTLANYRKYAENIGIAPNQFYKRLVAPELYLDNPPSVTTMTKYLLGAEEQAVRFVVTQSTEPSVSILLESTLDRNVLSDYLVSITKDMRPRDRGAISRDFYTLYMGIKRREARGLTGNPRMTTLASLFKKMGLDVEIVVKTRNNNLVRQKLIQCQITN